MIKLFLLFVAAIVVPPALSYGIDPAAVLPKSMAITVEGTDQIEMLRAIMGLYFGMTIFCVIAAFTPSWRHVAASGRPRPQPDRRRCSEPNPPFLHGGGAYRRHARASRAPTREAEDRG
jgi:hypothetical protein